MDSPNSKGKLTVKVSTAQGAIPIKDAVVYITSYTPNVSPDSETFSLRTNSDGITQTLELATPARSLSLSPGSAVVPNSEYVLIVKKDGYKTAELIGVPIFDGITSIQNVFLVPLTEDELLSGDITEEAFYENGNYGNLRSDGVEGLRRESI